MSWSTPFDDPILLPNRRQLVTLRDAAMFITTLPKAEHDAPEWQAAMEALILVSDRAVSVSFPTGWCRSLKPVNSRENE